MLRSTLFARVFLYSARMNIQFLKQNIYILHDVIFINDKKRYIGCHPIIYKTWHHSVPRKHNITDIYVGSLERKEQHFSCHMCTFIGIQEEVQFFITFLTHLFCVHTLVPGNGCHQQPGLSSSIQEDYTAYCWMPHCW